MQIYLLRHGEADQEIMDDRFRSLTSEGKETVNRIGSYLKSLNVKLDLIITSPVLRAFQTAEIILNIFGDPELLEESENLRPDKDLNGIILQLSKIENKNAVLLVGHQPLLGDIIAYLTSVARSTVGMKRAALACIEINPPIRPKGGTLKWIVAPDDLT